MIREKASCRICGVVSNCGPNGEPLACGYHVDHEGEHSWWTLPTFVNGEPDYVDCLRERLDQSKWIVCSEVVRHLPIRIRHTPTSEVATADSPHSVGSDS